MAVQNMRGTMVRRYVPCPECGKRGVYGLSVAASDVRLGPPVFVDAMARCRYCGYEHVWRGTPSEPNGRSARGRALPGICEPETT